MMFNIEHFLPPGRTVELGETETVNWLVLRDDWPGRRPESGSVF